MGGIATFDKKGSHFQRFGLKIFVLAAKFLSDEGPMLETLDHTIRIGSTPTFLYFDLYHICI